MISFLRMLAVFVDAFVFYLLLRLSLWVIIRVTSYLDRRRALKRLRENEGKDV